MAVKLELYRVFKEVAETGNISVAHRGKLTTRLSSTDLEHRLSQAFSKE